MALVVAEEFEIARFAASLVRVDYERRRMSPTSTRSASAPGVERDQHSITRGKAAERSSRRPCRSSEYRMPVEHHNPMETFAATAVWEGDGRITVFDKTQDRRTAGTTSPDVFGMPLDKVRVLSPYVGGAFGSGLRPQYQLPLAVLAARALKRPVRVT